MKKSTLLPLVAVVCLGWLGIQTWAVLFISPIWAQSKSSSKSKTTKKKAGATAVLDVKANEIQDNFVKEAETLAGEYYEAGDLDKARLLLKAVQTLKPDRANLNEKLKLLDEEQLSANETSIEINVRNGWEATGLMVVAGKPMRFKSEGSYKFDLSGQVSPVGFSVGKGPQDVVPDIPLGALVGIVLTEKPVPGAKEDDKKKDRPFMIGLGCEYTSQKDGMLYLRVNAPPECKNMGKIKVEVSGGVRSLK